MSLAIIAVGVGVAGAAGSAYLSNSAQQKGISAESAAINAEQGVNIPGITSLATQTDLAKYNEMFQAEASVDPQFAALRNQGAAGVLGVLADQANPNSVGNAALASAAKVTNANVPMTQSVINGLIADAQNELAMGATLPPAFQAELIRSGLAQGGAAGTGVMGEGATGVQTRTLLGSAGISLQQQRAAQAQSEVGTAAGLQKQQQDALAELQQLSINLNAAKAATASGAAGMGTAALPSLGLSGSQVAQLSVGNTNLENQKIASQGQLAAQSAASTGQMQSSIIGGLTGGLQGWLGNLMGSPGANAGVTGSGQLSAGGIPTNPGYTGFGTGGTTPSVLSGVGALTGLY